MNNPDIGRFIDAYDRLEKLAKQDSTLTPEDRDALKLFMADSHQRSIDFDELSKDRERLWCQLADLNDETPIDAEWLVSIGGEIRCDNESVVLVRMPVPDDTWRAIQVEWNPFYPEFIPSLDAVQDRKSPYGMEMINIPVPTRGAFRAAFRVLGITIEEQE